MLVESSLPPCKRSGGVLYNEGLRHGQTLADLRIDDPSRIRKGPSRGKKLGWGIRDMQS